MSYKYYSTERPLMPGSFPKPQGNTVFEGGSRTINVACDSGTAMIRDIMNHLEC